MAISKQGRLNYKADTDISGFYYFKDMFGHEPPYNVKSRKRDKWLREFVKREPNLLGVLNTVIDIDKNRGWQIIGGRNQVYLYTDILHNIQVAPGLRGWRPGCSVLSQSFWSSDLGAILEVGRNGVLGPVSALYTMDPASCQLTGNSDYPLAYYPSMGKIVPFAETDYVRVASMPSTDETMHGLGYCAVSRAEEIAKIMIAVYEHHNEQLGSKAPKGLLLLNGISQKTWNAAMQSRSDDLEGKDYEYFSAVAVLASSGATIEAKLLALSQLPVSFNLREWMDMVMFGYALCFGYDASEFWPVQFGAMGRGTETEIQHEKATGKGRLDFSLGLQEQIQEIFPESISFLVEQRDEKGDLLHAQVDKAWADLGKVLADTKDASGKSVLSNAENRVLLAQHGVIPTGWSPDETELSTDSKDSQNDVEVIDPNEGQDVPATAPTTTAPAKPAKTPPVNASRSAMRRQLRDTIMALPSTSKMIERMPSESVVQYTYPENKYTILFERADDLLRRESY